MHKSIKRTLFYQTIFNILKSYRKNIVIFMLTYRYQFDDKTIQ